MKASRIKSKIASLDQVTSHEHLPDEFLALLNKASAIQQYQILRLPAVCGKTGLSKASVWKRISEGTFPPAIPIGTRAVGWFEHELDAVLDAMRITTRGKIFLNLQGFVKLLVSVQRENDLSGIGRRE